MRLIAIILFGLFCFCGGYFTKYIRQPKDTKVEVEDEELKAKREKVKKIQKAFNELMDYDYETAIRGDK